MTVHCIHCNAILDPDTTYYAPEDVFTRDSPACIGCAPEDYIVWTLEDYDFLDDPYEETDE